MNFEFIINILIKKYPTLHFNMQFENTNSWFVKQKYFKPYVIKGLLFEISIEKRYYHGFNLSDFFLSNTNYNLEFAKRLHLKFIMSIFPFYFFKLPKYWFLYSITW